MNKSIVVPPTNRNVKPGYTIKAYSSIADTLMLKASVEGELPVEFMITRESAPIVQQLINEWLNHADCLGEEANE